MERSRGGQEDGAFIFVQLFGRGMVSEPLSLLPNLGNDTRGPLFSFLGPLTLAWAQTPSFPCALASGLGTWC